MLTYCTMCYMIHTTKHTKCVTQMYQIKEKRLKNEEDNNERN
nr:MAG TPA: hypothetical protein [Caudoviricetes sp.]